MKAVRSSVTLLRSLACLLAVGALGLAACGGFQAPRQARESRRLTVFAAASLTEAFAEIGRTFEASHPGVSISFNFAGSQQLAAQLKQGARADVFASADERQMASLVDAGLVRAGTAEIFARNQLAIIYPARNPGGVTRLADLGRPGLKLDLADPSVPAGAYALAMLEKIAQDPRYGPGFRGRVLANVVSREENVKVVLAKVRLGEVDAGIVYASDARRPDRQDIGVLLLPEQFKVPAIYPIAPVDHAAQPELARQYLDLVLSGQGQAILAEYGFTPVSTSRP